MHTTMLLADDPFVGGALRPRASWIDHGVTTRRLASPEFTAVIPGFLARTAEPPSLSDVTRAVLHRTSPHRALVCGATAAELLGLSLPFHLRTRHTGTIHLLSRDNIRLAPTRYRTWHRDRRGEQAPWMWLCGIGVIPGVEALCDVAPHLSYDELVTACDSLLDPQRHRGPHVSKDELRRQLETLVIAEPTLPGSRPTQRRSRARSGARAVLRALRDARENVLSPQETLARLLLRKARYPDPIPNFKVLDSVSEKWFYLDLAFLERKIAV